MSQQSFVKHAAVYGLATLLVQAGGFILVPLYTKCLQPADYGVLEVLGRLAETVGTCLLFGGFRQALLTFYQQSNGELERRRVVGSTLICLLVACLLGGGLLVAFARPLSSWLDQLWYRDGPPLEPHLLRLAVLAILLEPLSLIPLTLIQARVESTLFVIISVSQLVVRVLLLLLLVYELDWGVAGVLTATAGTAALYGIALSFREVVHGAAWPQLSQVRALVRFALPFVPGGLCFFLLHHGDRFFLLHCCGAEEVGIYALGYKLGMVVTMFSLNPLQMVWSPRMYEAARSHDASVIFGQVFTRILAVYLLGALAVGLFADELVRLLSGRAYARAADIVAPVLLACFFQAAASLMDSAFYVRHRTGRKLGITLLSTAVMLALYFLLIPRLGCMGAALATLAGFLFLAYRTWRVSQGIFFVRYEWGRLAFLLAMTAGLWLLSRGLPPTFWAAPLKLLLLLAAPALAWTSGLMSAVEKEHVAGQVRQGWQVVLRALGVQAASAERRPDRLRVERAASAHEPYLDDSGHDFPCLEEPVSF